MAREHLLVMRSNHLALRLGPGEIVGVELITKIDEALGHFAEIIDVIGATTSIFSGVVTRGNRPGLDRRSQSRVIFNHLKIIQLHFFHHSPESFTNIRIYRREAEIFGVDNSAPVKPRAGVTFKFFSDNLEKQARVGDTSSHRTVGNDRLPGGKTGLAGDRTETGLETDDTTESGGYAYRTATVTPQRESTHAGSDRNPGATGRATAGTLDIPGVRGESVEFGMRHPGKTEFGAGRLGKNNGTFLLQQLDRATGFGRYKIAQQLRAIGAGVAGEKLGILDRNRKPAEFAGVSAGTLLIRFKSCLPGSTVKLQRNRIE